MPEKKDDRVERILDMYCLDAVRIAAGTEDDDSAEDINFPCYTDELQARGFAQHFLSMDLVTYLLKCLFP